MRVTDASIYRAYLRNAASLDRRSIANLQALADGKRVRRGSDDPSGAERALDLRGRLARLEGYRRSSERARSELSAIDTALREAFNLVAQARTEAMAGASGVQSAGNAARADEIDAIREELLDLANTQRSGRYLFAGTDVRTTAFAADGTYQGNADEAQAPVDLDEDVGATLDGADVFQGSAGDVFALLENLSAALRADDTDAVAALVPQFGEQLDHLAQVRTDVGNRMNMIDRFRTRQEDERLELAKQISAVEDASVPEIVAELTRIETSTQALNGGAVRTLGRSLFDFLG